MSSKVITLVIPPGTGGVRDYADSLAHGLRTDGYDTRVFAWRKEDDGGIESQIAASDCLYLQYSGYGFAKGGAPLWMLHVLRERRSKIKRFGVFFHELYASGPPWGSAFWLSPIQHHVAAKLAELSDFWMTNRDLSGKWLSRHASDKPHATLPVFSNVGELSTYSSLRSRTIVVFGSSPVRRRAYTAVGSRLFSWARRCGLEIHDIGAPFVDDNLNSELVGHGVVQHGHIAPEAVGRVLSDAMFGVLAYPARFAAKSGVLAAYCAHGVAPVLLSESYPMCDGLAVGKQYLPAGFLDHNDTMEAYHTAEAAWRWYSEHSTRQHVLRTMGFLI